MSIGIERWGSHQGLDWLVVARNTGHRCGYVRVPKGHPLHELSYTDTAPGFTAEELRAIKAGKRGVLATIRHSLDPDRKPSLDVVFDVHGSLTFSGELEGQEGWWLGFDCDHHGDAKDPTLCTSLIGELLLTVERRAGLLGTIRTADYVEHECKRLAQQIADRYPPDAEGGAS